ncbi:unnamed protein product [Parajaminaea phylloscopi]
MYENNTEKPTNSETNVAAMSASDEKKASAAVSDMNAVQQYSTQPVNLERLDEGAKLMLEFEGQLDDVTEEEYDRIRRRIDWHLLPLMMALYWIQFGDKTSLGNSAILGIKADNDLDQNRFNQCSSFFYISYLVFEYPLSLCLQRFRTGKVLTAAVFSWAILLLAHMASNSFPGLLVLRLLLGATESIVTPAFLLVTSAYYKLNEQATRVGYWFLFNGFAIITNSLIAYGAQFAHIGHWKPWRTFFLILGLLTFVLAVLYLFFFPDTPATAWFLTPRERAIAIKRVASNQSGTKSKHLKKDQLIEAFTDPKTWIFCGYSMISNVPNSLTQQRSIIINQLGFNSLQTALLNIPVGVIEIVSIPLATYIARKWVNRTATVMTMWTLPSIVGASMLIGLSDEHKIARLIGVYMAPLQTAAFVLALSWCSASTAGTTKKNVVNATNLIAYCIGNLVGPYIWQAKFAPHNTVPWAVCLVIFFLLIPVSYSADYVMRTENKRRDAAFGSPTEGGGAAAHEVTINVADKDIGAGGEGGAHTHRLDTAFLDLTDRQNMNFRYPL